MNPTILFTIISTIFILAIFAVIFLIYRRRTAPKKATGKEYNANLAINAAKKFAHSNSYRFISPAVLARSGMVANLDAIVIGYFGILGVKTYGYNGELYGTMQEAEWVQVSEEGDRVYFPNPITEAANDVRVIRDALFAAKIKTTPVEVVCVFTNDKAQLGFPRSTGHYTTKTFKQLLGSSKYTEDTGLDLDVAEKIIRESLSE